MGLPERPRWGTIPSPSCANKYLASRCAVCLFDDFAVLFHRFDPPLQVLQRLFRVAELVLRILHFAFLLADNLLRLVDFSVRTLRQTVVFWA
jgi:hypothetical protein